MPRSSSTKCYVALGANLGKPTQTIKRALELIRDHEQIFSLRCSKFHETIALSPIAQPNFINAVCCFECTLSLHELFSYLEEVERALGKRSKPKSAPRLIDLDLIFYGDVVHRSAKLTIPHPRWKERTFVLQPLAELL